MYISDTEDLLTKREKLRLSDHALREAHKEGLHAQDIFHAIFNGEVAEQYPERDRVLIIGPMKQANMSLHVVCDYFDRQEIVVVTVYIPSRAKWVTDGVRRHANAQHAFESRRYYTNEYT